MLFYLGNATQSHNSPSAITFNITKVVFLLNARMHAYTNFPHIYADILMMCSHFSLHMTVKGDKMEEMK